MNLRKFQLLMSKYGFSIIIMVLELALIFGFLLAWSLDTYFMDCLCDFIQSGNDFSDCQSLNDTRKQSNLALGSVCSSHWFLALFNVW